MLKIDVSEVPTNAGGTFRKFSNAKISLLKISRLFSNLKLITLLNKKNHNEKLLEHDHLFLLLEKHAKNVTRKTQKLASKKRNKQQATSKNFHLCIWQQKEVKMPTFWCISREGTWNNCALILFEGDAWS